MAKRDPQALPPIRCEPVYKVLFDGVTIGAREAHLFLSLQSRQIIARWVYETLCDEGIEVRVMPTPYRDPSGTPPW